LFFLLLLLLAKLPPTLLSRFDLIFLLLDTPNEEADRKLAAHMTALYFSPENRARLQREEFIPRATLTQYISFVAWWREESMGWP
jgi:DNA replication licensing factor MCM4